MKWIKVFSPGKPLLVILLVVCLLVGGGAAFHWLGRDGVEVIRPHRGLAVQAVYATGTVEPFVMLPIAPRIAARLKELHVDEGATVEKISCSPGWRTKSCVRRSGNCRPMKHS